MRLVATLLCGVAYSCKSIEENATRSIMKLTREQNTKTNFERRECYV